MNEYTRALALSADRMLGKLGYHGLVNRAVVLQKTDFVKKAIVAKLDLSSIEGDGIDEISDLITFERSEWLFRHVQTLLASLSFQEALPDSFTRRRGEFLRNIASKVGESINREYEKDASTKDKQSEEDLNWYLSIVIKGMEPIKTSLRMALNEVSTRSTSIKPVVEIETLDRIFAWVHKIFNEDNMRGQDLINTLVNRINEEIQEIVGQWGSDCKEKAKERIIKVCEYILLKSLQDEGRR